MSAAPDTSNDHRAIALIDEYLGRQATDAQKADPHVFTAFKLGTAQAMLCSLLELYEYSIPDATRQVFELWRFKKAGDKASFHYADDSTREWDKADKAKAEALAIFDAHPELHAQMREIAAGFLWTLKGCGR